MNDDFDLQNTDASNKDDSYEYPSDFISTKSSQKVFFEDDNEIKFADRPNTFTDKKMKTFFLYQVWFCQKLIGFPFLELIYCS